MVVPKADYRFRRGSKLADFPPIPPQPAVPPLSSLDGPFQLAEYLSLKVRHDPHDIKGLVDVPSDNAKAADKHVWIYEHLRRIPIDATPLITQLLQMCSRESCPEMKADEWLYLCVAHGGEGTDRCCAIDYILHTVDSTTALLNSSNYFPSRLQIPHASLAHFPSLFRRLSRIFSHAYFHHREAFATAEAETSLYARFVALCEKYELVSSNLLIIPASGYEVTVMHDDGSDDEDKDDDDDDEHDDDYDLDADDDETGQGRGQKEDKEDKDKDEHSEPSEEREGEHADGTVSPREDGLRQAHSLGRYQSPGKWSTSPVQPATKGKPAPAHTSETLSPPSTRATLDGYEGESGASSPGPTPPTSTLPKTKRGTLSRGKAPRAANLWAAEPMPDAAKAPEDKDATEAKSGAKTEIHDEGTEAEADEPPIGMARKESVDSVVYVGKDDDEASSPVDIPASDAVLAAESSSSPPSLADSPAVTTSRLGVSPRSIPPKGAPTTSTSPPPSTIVASTSTPSSPALVSSSLSAPTPISTSPRGATSSPHPMGSPKPTNPGSVSPPSASPPTSTLVSASALKASSPLLSTSPPSPEMATTVTLTPSAGGPSTSPADKAAIGTSPRSELQARRDGKDALAVSPRTGTGKRGQGRKSRVPRSPGKKGRKETAEEAQ